MKRQVLILFTMLSILSGCGNDYSPKPRGYFKIDLPEKKYRQYTSDCPYTFEYPVYAQIQPDQGREAGLCWIDVVYPQFNGRVHLSFQSFSSGAQLNELTEDAYTFAFKHTVKATAIDEARISYPEKDVYGVYYTIDGNTASNLQFYLTDSSRNYVRGALYFNEKPRQDSIQPVLDFIKTDIDKMIKTFSWRN